MKKKITAATVIDGIVRLVISLMCVYRSVPDTAGVRFVVSESGVYTRADIERLADARVDAVLVGESLMRQPDIAAAVDALLGN